MFNNEDLVFGADVSYEDLLSQKEQLLDMSQATEGWGWLRQRQASKSGS